MFIIYVNKSNKFNFWSVHGIMNTSALLQSSEAFGLHLLCKRPEVFMNPSTSLTLQETRSIHDSIGFTYFARDPKYS